MPKFKIALLCGGPSLERAISLNSARTVLDHLSSDKIEILPVYYDYKKRPYLISSAQLYSNTPADFDFKLKQTAKPLSQKQLISFLKKANITFPVMHGRFGEDGEIQKFLENNRLPFIGSSSGACALAFDKHKANQFLKRKGFYTLPSISIPKKNYREYRQHINTFFKNYGIKQAIVKPAISGSSIAVYPVDSVKEAISSCQKIFSKNVDSRAVIEPFCQGREFTVIILENKAGRPVAILPTEIDLPNKKRQIFDYRKKYLPTNQVFYHCPPRFADKIVYSIQKQAQELFSLFSLRDFARFDGWLMPDGKIWFSDFNPISGMEQNSFLFIQSSRLGFSHRNFLEYILENACRRYNLKFPERNHPALKHENKKNINVIFGGDTVERQVSVMSGTNTWLKLKNSDNYRPQPYLLDKNNQVWQLPYALTLNHTVEEIAKNCRQAGRLEKRLRKLSAKILAQLQPGEDNLTAPWFLPKKMSLVDFIKRSSYVFIGLHGGIGENGKLQKLLEKHKKPFNGSNSAASALCMDKFATGLKLMALKDQGIYSAKKKIVDLNFLKTIAAKNQSLIKYWKLLRKDLGSATVIVKPVDDGCTAGIARIYQANDLKIYLNFALKNAPIIPHGRLNRQHGIIEMPSCPMEKIMFEEFIATDKIQAIDNRLIWKKNTGWIEITVGLLEKGGKMRAFSPSLTVASGNVLTLEEKFQGGTGINITPLPAQFVKTAAVNSAKKRAETVAQALGIRGYARLDAFMNIKTGELIIIEANTLPGLTPSTVIFHQALAENPPLYPKEFLEEIIGQNF